jgi:outer membrane lipoprotein-sorting protein
MLRKRLLVLGVAAAFSLSGAIWAADGKAAPAKPAIKLSAEQIVEKNFAARGGTTAWHGVQSMSWNGKMEVGYADSVARSQRYVSQAAARTGRAERMALEEEEKNAQNAKQVELPFVMEMKRPGKERVEIEFGGKTAIQVYDGKDGWMMRPFLNRTDWEPFSQEQAKSQADTLGIDGALFDYAAKGTKVAVEGIEAVDGHDAYKLKLTRKGGEVRHVWIDTQSFLDVKVEGTPRRMDGKMHAVWIYQRDFRPVKGLMVPFAMETAVEGYRDTHKMTIEKVGLNPQLADTLFVKPTS